MRYLRIKALAKKELIQIVRDWRSLALSVIIPVVMLLLFGFALTLDVDNVPMAVLNQDKSQESLDFLLNFRSSRYFKVTGYFDDYRQLESEIDHNRAMMAMVIPPGFGAGLRAGRQVQVQLVVDGTDSNTALIALSYVEAVVGRYNTAFLVRARDIAGLKSLPSLDLEPRVWFNETLKSRNFIIPGLIAVIMSIIAALLTSMTVAREWERGTMEQLISTPVTTLEIVIGKVAPYFVVGFFDLLIVMAMAQFVFHVPLRGDVGLLLVLSSLFMAGAMSLGLFISITTRNQLLSSQIAMLGTFLPAFLLSGFAYAIANMPAAVQLITYLVPARYFISVARGIYLKGVGLEVLWPQAVFLSVFAATMLILSVKKFKKKVA